MTTMTPAVRGSLIMALVVAVLIVAANLLFTGVRGLSLVVFGIFMFVVTFGVSVALGRRRPGS